MYHVYDKRVQEERDATLGSTKLQSRKARGRT
jgi:hypothetical protein